MFQYCIDRSVLFVIELTGASFIAKYIWKNNYPTESNTLTKLKTMHTTSNRNTRLFLALIINSLTIIPLTSGIFISHYKINTKYYSYIWKVFHSITICSIYGFMANCYNSIRAKLQINHIESLKTIASETQLTTQDMHIEEEAMPMEESDDFSDQNKTRITPDKYIFLLFRKPELIWVHETQKKLI